MTVSCFRFGGIGPIESVVRTPRSIQEQVHKLDAEYRKVVNLRHALTAEKSSLEGPRWVLRPTPQGSAPLVLLLLPTAPMIACTLLQKQRRWFQGRKWALPH